MKCYAIIFLIFLILSSPITAVPTAKYDRIKAVNYANKYCQNPNPSYEVLSGADCTNFASQVLFNGGIPYDTNKIWQPYTGAWINVISFYNYLKKDYLAKDCKLTELKPGDFIQYRNSTSHVWDHTVVVVKGGADPTVDYHSSNRCNVKHSGVLSFGKDMFRGVCITK
ncbi:21378_t:CDS:1 [Cetraspora pellucida]|uniref:21378_t:CDS:1 n=1 Tax=Cetraspora pellucida TaxID=1433469 RepID=A0A9N9HL99_9GLOM|nr:21378_t:CDS:1 [Cetraspora pellucida]